MAIVVSLLLLLLLPTASTCCLVDAAAAASGMMCVRASTFVCMYVVCVRVSVIVCLQRSLFLNDDPKKSFCLALFLGPRRRERPCDRRQKPADI